jgi:hypothetical protein
MIKCEVCGIDLKQSGNVNIYTCTSKLLYNEEHKKYIEDRHYTCHLDDNNVVTYKMITVFPFCFQMFYDENKSSISKMTIRHKTQNSGKSSMYTTDRKDILWVNSILNLPWDDKEQLMQKISMYSLFS